MQKNKKVFSKSKPKPNSKKFFKAIFVALVVLIGISYLFFHKYSSGAADKNVLGESSSIPAPVIKVKSPITESKMYFNDDTGRMNAEVTPWALGSKATGGWYTYLTSTFQTFMCHIPTNIFTLTTDEKFVSTNCSLRTKPNISEYNPNKFMPLWKRDYIGVFTAHLISTGSDTITLYSINHNESYNNADASKFYPLVPTCVQADDMGYGKLPCEPKYWWGSYNAWITMSTMPWDTQNLNSPTLFTHLGPITWPSNGYIESLDGNSTWIKATDGGVRTPTSIIKDNYLYVYYEDLSQGQESLGRGPGIKVIRAPITSNGISPKSFKAYYNGSFTDSSLPTNFVLDVYYKFLHRKGPRASSLFPQLTRKVQQPTLGTKRNGPRLIGDVVSFQVAKISNTGYYLGVSHELSRGVTLRLSTDLVNWSESVLVPGTKSDWWTGSVDLQKLPFLYPRLANKNGDSNTTIDAGEFYIIGTQTKLRNGSEAKVVNTIKLSIDLP